MRSNSPYPGFSCQQKIKYKKSATFFVFLTSSFAKSISLFLPITTHQTENVVRVWRIYKKKRVRDWKQGKRRVAGVIDWACTVRWQTHARGKHYMEYVRFNVDRHLFFNIISELEAEKIMHIPFTLDATKHHLGKRERKTRKKRITATLVHTYTKLINAKKKMRSFETDQRWHASHTQNKNTEAFQPRNQRNWKALCFPFLCSKRFQHTVLLIIIFLLVTPWTGSGTTYTWKKKDNKYARK